MVFAQKYISKLLEPAPLNLVLTTLLQKCHSKCYGYCFKG